MSIYYKPSLFNAHTMILIVHIFMNVNKLCLNQYKYNGSTFFPSNLSSSVPSHVGLLFLSEERRLDSDVFDVLPQISSLLLMSSLTLIAGYKMAALTVVLFATFKRRFLLNRTRNLVKTCSLCLSVSLSLSLSVCLSLSVSLCLCLCLSLSLSRKD